MGLVVWERGEAREEPRRFFALDTFWAYLGGFGSLYFWGEKEGAWPGMPRTLCWFLCGPAYALYIYARARKGRHGVARELEEFGRCLVLVP